MSYLQHDNKLYFIIYVLDHEYYIHVPGSMYHCDRVICGVLVCMTMCHKYSKKYKVIDMLLMLHNIHIINDNVLTLFFVPQTKGINADLIYYMEH